jgi:hypothetical protein
MSSVAIPKEDRTTCSYRKIESDSGSLARPALEALVRDGVLVNLGSWYRVQRPDDLPTNLRFGGRVIRVKGLMLIKFAMHTSDCQSPMNSSGIACRRSDGSWEIE